MQLLRRDLQVTHVIALHVGSACLTTYCSSTPASQPDHMEQEDLTDSMSDNILLQHTTFTVTSVPFVLLQSPKYNRCLTANKSDKACKTGKNKACSHAVSRLTDALALQQGE